MRAVLVATVLALVLTAAGNAAPRFRVVAAHGIRLTVPAGWRQVAPAGAGAVVDPKTLLVVGTAGVTPKPSVCQIAAYRVPPRGAVVVVVGWSSLRNSGASGAKQGRGPLAQLVRVRQPSFECFSGRGAAADVVLRGKAYQVNVLVGDGASRRVVAQALAIGRSFDLAISVAPAAALPHAPGWHIGTARIANGSCRRCVQVDSWGATVPYRDAANDFPHNTMAALGKHDVIIQVTRSWEPSPPRWELARHPLRIRRAQIHANFEGNTTHGRVSLWSGATWRNGSAVEVYVYFGSARPSAADVSRAQRELDGTTWPRWTIRR